MGQVWEKGVEEGDSHCRVSEREILRKLQSRAMLSAAPWYHAARSEPC